MTRRSTPVFEPFKPIRAPFLNRLSTEIGRLTGLPTGGDDEFVDNACGRFYLPSSGVGGGIIPFVVTEGDSSIPVAVYRTSHDEYGFLARKVDRNGTPSSAELSVYADFMYGVIYTDSLFWATRFQGRWYVVSTGADFWSTGVTNEAIDTDGTGMVELYEDGPMVDATSRTSVPISTSVDVEFDDREQLFCITAQNCPPTP